MYSNHLLQILRLLEDLELALGTATVLQHRVDVFDLAAAVEFVEHIVHELEILEHQLARRHFLFLAEVDQLAVQAVAGGAPLVLHDQGAAVHAEPLVPRMQLVQLHHRGLDQRGERERFVGAHRDVADPHFDGREKRMRPDVPPDLLGVVDRVGLDQQVDEAFVVGPARERIGNVGARELVEHLAAVRLQPGIEADPEGRVGRKREQVRQKVAHLVHQVNGRFAVLDADVHVQAEDQVRARHQLHVLDDLQVALVGINVLHAPVGERVRRAGAEQQAVLAGELHHGAPQVEDVGARLLHVAAHAGADLDHRLVHLRLDALVQLALALGDNLGVDVRAEIEGVGIDGLIFLLDADGEGGLHGRCPIKGRPAPVGQPGHAATERRAPLHGVPLRNASQR